LNRLDGQLDLGHLRILRGKNDIQHNLRLVHHLGVPIEEIHLPIVDGRDNLFVDLVAIEEPFHALDPPSAAAKVIESQ